MSLFDGMNAEQLEVIRHADGPLLVAAVAGCGKTRALVHRIVHLIRSGAEPSRILAVTFSSKAAREMSNRLAKLGCTDARVGTFHSVAFQIIREDLPEYRGWRIDDSDRYRICVKDAVSYKNMNWMQADVTYLLSFIALCKAAGAYATPEDPKALAIARAFYAKRPTAGRLPQLCIQAYVTAELLRRERQVLQFDDMLFEAWALFCRDDSARFRWAARWDHVLQDECQDENFVQHELASQLARDHRSYMIVGDPAQSIYRFRGAEPRAMLEFEREWQSHVVRMGRNYRSGSKIVAVANRCLAAMPSASHLGVTLVADRETEGEVRVVRYDNFDAEGEGVVERILESHEDDRPWRHHVVLYRTNAQSRAVEESLLSGRVPYVVLGGTNFYERREVRDLLAYLRIAAGIGRFEDVKRSINTPFRYLGKVFLDGLAEQASDLLGYALIDAVRQYAETARLQKRQHGSVNAWRGVVERMRLAIERGGLSTSQTRDSPHEVAAKPQRLLDGLVSELRYTDWLTKDEGAESPENNRVSNVRELIRAAGRFPTTAELLGYIDDTIARAVLAKREAGSSDVVTLCSIHRSKGLEWPVVFVLGCNEKILPHAMADDLAEERRLFYVACTRAADELEVSFVGEAAVGNRIIQLEPSQFLAEAGLQVTKPNSQIATSEAS